MRSQRRERHQRGHTMIELIIVLALLGAVLALVFPRMDLAPPLASAGRSLIGLMHALVEAASSSKTHYRLYLDFDQRSYSVVTVAPDGAGIPLNAALARPTALPAGVRFLDAVVGPQEKAVSGRVGISFYPTGRTDRSLLHLVDGSGDILTVALDPLTASVKTWDGYVEPIAPPPVPESFRPWLIVLPPPPPPPSAAPAEGGTSGTTAPAASSPAAQGGAPPAPVPPSPPPSAVTSPTKRPEVTIPWVY